MSNVQKLQEGTFPREITFHFVYTFPNSPDIFGNRSGVFENRSGIARDLSHRNLADTMVKDTST